MTLWSLFCRWRWRRHQGLADEWERRFMKVSSALKARWRT